MYIYIYIYICNTTCNTTYFVTFSEVTIVRCSRKCLFLKYGRKRAKFLEMLEAAIFFQGFPCINGWFFKTSFADIFRNMPLL